MKLKTRLMIFTAAVACTATMAAAAITSTDVVSTYRANNFTYIEVKESPTQIKVEAIKDAMYIEVVYEKSSGAVLSSETGAASVDDAAQVGVSVVQVEKDFEGEDDALGMADDADYNATEDDDDENDDGIDNDGQEVDGDESDDPDVKGEDDAEDANDSPDDNGAGDETGGDDDNSANSGSASSSRCND